MSLDPKERLEQLRREVVAESASVAPPAPRVPDPSAPPTGAPITASDGMPRPSVPAPAGAPRPSAITPADVPGPGAAAAPAPEVGHGWDVQELLADTSLSTWLGIGLVAVGGYMVLSWFVPGIDLVGSLLLLGAGVVLLAQHIQRGAGSWALYAGALLTGMGAGRAIGDILPGSPHGLTAVGVGCAFLAIASLRHAQAGGYGWQGIVGSGVLALGLVQLVLGLLPGSPGLLDLILPALLLIGGGMLIGRALRRPADA